MDISKLKTSELRQVISLVEKRAKAEEALAAIDQQLATLFGGGKTSPAPKAKKVIRKKRRLAKSGKAAKAPKAAPAAAKKPAKAAAKATPKAASPAPAKAKGKGKRPRGEMKKLILAALETAGPKGMSVKELTTALKVPSQNIHVWFSSTGKNLPSVGKNEQGRWTYKKP